MLAVLAMVFAYTLWAIVGVGLGLDQESGSSLAVLLTVLPGVGFALGLLAPRWLNVDVALRWCVLLGCSSITLATTILATVALAEGLGASAQDSSSPAAAVAAALTIPVVGLPRRPADRFVYGRRPSPLRALEELGTRLAQLADPRDVPVHRPRRGDRVPCCGRGASARRCHRTGGGRAPPPSRNSSRSPTAMSGSRPWRPRPRPGETTLIARDRSVITRIGALLQGRRCTVLASRTSSWRLGRGW